MSPSKVKFQIDEVQVSEHKTRFLSYYVHGRSKIQDVPSSKLTCACSRQYEAWNAASSLKQTIPIPYITVDSLILHNCF